jgi:hypothetical protein
MTDLDLEAATHEAARVRQRYIHGLVSTQVSSRVTLEAAAAGFEREYPELARMARVWAEREVCS